MSVPIILIFNALVALIFFFVAAFFPREDTPMNRRDKLDWRAYAPYAAAAGLFFAVGNMLWFYTISRGLPGILPSKSSLNPFSAIPDDCRRSMDILGLDFALYS